MRRFLISSDDIEAGRPHLTGVQARHAANVLRLKKNDHVEIIDGEGNEYQAKIISIKPKNRDGVELEIIKKLPSLPESPLDLTLGLAVLKSDAMDMVVAKATELGLKTLIPLTTKFSSFKLDKDKQQRKIERWKKISLEALKQCRRSKPLDITEVMALETFISQAPAGGGKIMLYEKSAGLSTSSMKKITAELSISKPIWTLIGPEGGFDSTEVDLAKKAGFEITGLGPRILRAETAALTLISILGFELGDLAKKEKSD